jgi:mono/diheme cytochrome c family protein
VVERERIHRPPPGEGQPPGRALLAWRFGWIFTISFVVAAARAAGDDAVSFRADVQPILVEHCYECHGPEKRKGDLRLTNRRDAFTPAETGVPVIVPGSSETSMLIDLVSSSDPEERMPKKGNALSKDEIEILRRWIDQGADWPEDEQSAPQHWAYRPPRRPDTPEVRDPSWVRNPIDAFILERLESRGLRPALPADKESLLRRVSLDLVGLPPTPAERDAFLADDSPGAYEALVDRLLSSPHFGEQWARSWLDQARYADSNGYTSDYIREAWLYRDWVIDAINADMPFDQFTVEQLAGDLLPDPTVSQRIATGFHRNTMISLEAGVNFEEARIEQIVNRVNTTGTVWLASTFECAQCHNQKYDPLTLEDYYRFYAFFNNTPIEGEEHKDLPKYRTAVRSSTSA